MIGAFATDTTVRDGSFSGPTSTVTMHSRGLEGRLGVRDRPQKPPSSTSEASNKKNLCLYKREKSHESFL
jgi:hypothetical protein